jgi:hypothetical protein
MSQHDFNIANQLFPATRADLNSAFVALASNSSGDAEPGTTYANQWWYETDTNTLKLRNEANNAWIEIATLDQTSNNVLSITTQGLTLGATALTATGTELNQLAAITRGSILYGNASGATDRLANGAADTVLTSDGTDISWQAAAAATVPTTLNAVGTYAFLQAGTGSGTFTANPGDERAGSGLYYTNRSASETTSVQPSGTWQCMGYMDNLDRATLWVKISE